MGKSSVFGELAKLTNGTALLEPEETDWPAAVKHRETVGYFTGLTWFRAARVPLYYEAVEIRDRGGLALLDSYYDKLCRMWLGRPGVEWLLAPDDPYFPAAAEVAALDWESLPLADVLVLFTIDEALWRKLIIRRGRHLDQASALGEHYATQDYFVSAAEHLAETTRITLVRFHQDRLDDPAQAAQRLVTLLLAADALP